MTRKEARGNAKREGWEKPQRVLCKAFLAEMSIHKLYCGLDKYTLDGCSSGEHGLGWTNRYAVAFGLKKGMGKAVPRFAVISPTKNGAGILLTIRIMGSEYSVTAYQQSDLKQFYPLLKEKYLNITKDQKKRLNSNTGNRRIVGKKPLKASKKNWVA